MKKVQLLTFVRTFGKCLILIYFEALQMSTKPLNFPISLPTFATFSQFFFPSTPNLNAKAAKIERKELAKLNSIILNVLALPRSQVKRVFAFSSIDWAEKWNFVSTWTLKILILNVLCAQQIIFHSCSDFILSSFTKHVTTLSSRILKRFVVSCIILVLWWRQLCQLWIFANIFTSRKFISRDFLMGIFSREKKI